MIRRGRRSVLSALVFVMLAASCGDDGPGQAEARLVVDGSVTVTRSDGAAEVIDDDSSTLDFGDSFVVDDGTATLELAAGQTYEFRAGPVASEVLVGAPPTLLAGDGLVTGGFPAAIAYDTTTLSAQGALKVSAGTPLAAAYAGRTTISGAGDLDMVRGLRQVVLTSSASPEPFAYDGGDAWDRRYLGEAVALGERLEALARGYTNDLRPGPRPASFYEAVLPALAEEREFSGDLLDDRPTGETLVGAAIVIQGRSGTFRERWEQVFAFRDQGALWGLVALDQGVSSAPVLDTIELAIADSPLSDDPRATSSTDGGSPTTTAPSGTSTTSTTTTTPTTPTTPPPPEDDGALTPVVTPVEQILDDVFDVLGLG